MADTGKAERVHLEVVRALELQERSLESLRGRCALVLSASLLVAGFVASSADHRGGWWGVGIGALVLASGSALLASRSVELWSTNDGYTMVRTYVDDENYTATEMYRSLALFGQANFDRNEARIRSRRRLFTFSLGAIAIEAAALLIGLVP